MLEVENKLKNELPNPVVVAAATPPIPREEVLMNCLLLVPIRRSITIYKIGCSKKKVLLRKYISELKK